ncbi:MAG: RHS repeat protein, partial [SAR324 cluster bacterium]|nr:RHS repeat protein [SAR324 cluster bacterium]
YIADYNNSLIRAINYGQPYGTTREYSAPFAEESTLLRHPDETYTRYMPDESRILFDTEGKQTHFIDPNGNTTTYEYCCDGYVSVISDPYGGETNLMYQDNRLQSIEDAAGRQSLFHYDGDGNLTSTIQPF